MPERATESISHDYKVECWKSDKDRFDQDRLDAQRYRKLRAARSEIFNRTEWAELRACTSFDFDITVDAKPDPSLKVGTDGND